MTNAITKKITIEITEAQEAFLKHFAKDHYLGSDKNLATMYPIHIVQTQRERVVDSDYESVDKVIYYDSDSCESYDSVEEAVQANREDDFDDECDCEEEDFDEDGECQCLYQEDKRYKFLTYKEAYDADSIIGYDREPYVIAEEDDYLEAYNLNSLIKTNIGYYYEDIAYFFILEEAKRYMKYQKHNLCNPRTYTMSPGYSNCGDFIPFWNLLNSVGTQLLKEEDTKDDIKE